MLQLRALRLEDEEQFIDVMKKSKEFYYPFITPITEHEQFHQYYLESRTESLKSYLALDDNETIVGVFTISEIVRGCFQSGYLGYGVNVDYAGAGLMSQALKMVLEKAFLELKLHRVEANVQPTNTPSIRFITQNGFRKEGFSPRYLKVNNQWCDHFRFALTYEDWLAYNV
ncbi:MAG: GNAT family protein [Legionella sp.]|uniref:GNAT family N-acetyltransferase n=1 Tax=Legionella sp. TaxID=459 RepID=UPI002845A18F|nr:GNAT family protein [Legionella sp.]